MTLKGNLLDFSLVQLLNLVSLATKTGALYIEGVNHHSKLVFREGKLTFGLVDDQHIHLIRVLARTKMIPNSQAASLCERYKNLSDKEMGIVLINSGYLTQGQIIEGVEKFLKEIIRVLFTWREGEFYFEEGELPPTGIIPIRMPLEDIIIEGSRLISELEDLRDEIPSLEMKLRFSDRPGVNIRNVQLNAEEWRVVSYVDPKNSIQQIAGAAKLNEIQIRRVVYNLLQAGLVELVRPNGSSVQAERQLIPLKLTVEHKSLLNRVIDRIKAI